MYQNMEETDIRTVSIESLVDIRDVMIQKELPKEQRIKAFIEQINNPYCFRYKNAVVKLCFQDTGNTLEEKLENYAMSLLHSQR